MGLLIFVDVLLAIIMLCAVAGIVDAMATRSKIGMVLTFLALFVIICLATLINVSFLSFIHSGGLFT